MTPCCLWRKVTTCSGTFPLLATLVGPVRGNFFDPNGGRAAQPILARLCVTKGRRAATVYRHIILVPQDDLLSRSCRTRVCRAWLKQSPRKLSPEALVPDLTSLNLADRCCQHQVGEGAESNSHSGAVDVSKKEKVL